MTLVRAWFVISLKVGIFIWRFLNCNGSSERRFILILVLIVLQMERKEMGIGPTSDFPNGFDIFANNAFFLSQCVRSLLRTHNTNLLLAPLRPLKLKKGNTLLSGLLLCTTLSSATLLLLRKKLQETNISFYRKRLLKMSFCSRSRLHIKLGCGCPDMSLYMLPKT